MKNLNNHEKVMIALSNGEKHMLSNDIRPHTLLTLHEISTALAALKRKGYVKVVGQVKIKSGPTANKWTLTKAGKEKVEFIKNVK